MKITTDMVKTVTAVASVKTVARRDLVVGDLYKNRSGGRIYMHTGLRTAPPSGHTVDIVVGSQTFTVNASNIKGYTDNGDAILGWQSIIVDGDVKSGSDGAAITFDGDKDVLHVGYVDLNLNLFS